MKKRNGLMSLVVIVVVVWLAMRVVHVLLPVVRPEVLPGPFHLDTLAEVEAITGFSARVPLYHPESLGRDPVTITATRRPEAEVIIVWRGRRFLELAERAVEAEPFAVPDDAELVEDRQLHVWKRGAVTSLVGTVRGVHLRLRTDLTREDVMRIVSTLVPLEEVK